jgi:hypothetical protein
MRIKKRILLLFIVPFFAFTAHKYYLSLTQIEYNSKNKSIEVIINVFIDDIETSLNKTLNKDFKLNTDDELKDSDTYFSQYLKDHVQFKINGKPVFFNFLGKEYDGDIVFFYLEIKDIESVKDIEINNTLLIEQFTEQQNLVKSKVNKKYKSVMLTKKDQKGILKH